MKKIALVFVIMFTSFVCVTRLTYANDSKEFCNGGPDVLLEFGWHSKDQNILGKITHEKPVLRENVQLSCFLYESLNLYGGIRSQQGIHVGNRLGDYHKYDFGTKFDFHPLTLKFDWSYTYTDPGPPNAVGSHEYILRISRPTDPWPTPYYWLAYIFPAHKNGVKEGFVERFGVFWEPEFLKFYLWEEKNIKSSIKFDISTTINHGSRNIDSGLTHVRLGLEFPIKYKNLSVAPYYTYQIVADKFNDGKIGDISKGNTSYFGIKFQIRF